MYVIDELLFCIYIRLLIMNAILFHRFTYRDVIVASTN